MRYDICVQDDVTTGRLGCVVWRDNEALRGRYDFSGEACARAWADLIIAQYEDMRLRPQSLKSISDAVKRYWRERGVEIE